MNHKQVRYFEMIPGEGRREAQLSDIDQKVLTWVSSKTKGAGATWFHLDMLSLMQDLGVENTAENDALLRASFLRIAKLQVEEHFQQ